MLSGSATCQGSGAKRIICTSSNFRSVVASQLPPQRSPASVPQVTGVSPVRSRRLECGPARRRCCQNCCQSIKRLPATMTLRWPVYRGHVRPSRSREGKSSAACHCHLEARSRAHSDGASRFHSLLPFDGQRQDALGLADKSSPRAARRRVRACHHRRGRLLPDRHRHPHGRHGPASHPRPAHRRWRRRSARTRRRSAHPGSPGGPGPVRVAAGEVRERPAGLEEGDRPVASAGPGCRAPARCGSCQSRPIRGGRSALARSQKRSVARPRMAATGSFAETVNANSSRMTCSSNWAARIRRVNGRRGAFLRHGQLLGGVGQSVVRGSHSRWSGRSETTDVWTTSQFTLERGGRELLALVTRSGRVHCKRTDRATLSAYPKPQPSAFQFRTVAGPKPTRRPSERAWPDWLLTKA
jgi:hypothetical protein